MSAGGKNSFLCVKSLLTMVLTVTFCVLTVLHPETYSETMKTLITTVVAFYFGTQFQKGVPEPKKGSVNNE